MKIIRFDSFNESASVVVPDSFFTQNAILMADSVLRPHRRPLFVPAEGFWICELRPAVKISLLGKGIARGFAPRYYNEFTLVNYTHCQTEPDQAFTPGFMLDDALVHGQWIPLPAGPVNLTVEGLHETSDSKEFTLSTAFVDHALAALSGHATFKTGDIIVLPHVILRYIPHPGSHITADVDGERILDFKIK